MDSRTRKTSHHRQTGPAVATLTTPHSALRVLAAVALVFVVAAGCGYTPQAESGPAAPSAQNPAAQKAPPTKEELLKALAQFQKEAKTAPIPACVIELPLPEGWTRSKPRALPPADHGFTIAYDHPSGAMVTFYQYTRGRATIGEEVPSPALQEELRGAKTGIDQAVQVGVWQSAKEKASGVASLGDSKQKALWSQHELVAKGETMTSDTYVWARGNALLKIRATGRAGQKHNTPDPLRSLLTALGNAKLAPR